MSAPITYTTRYAAPEILLAESNGASEIVVRSTMDLFSMGITTWEFLTGNAFL